MKRTAMRISFLLLLLLQSLFSSGQQQGFIKKFSGTIGKAEIIADVKIIDSTFSGRYYYLKEENPVLLKGTIKNLNLAANEITDDSITATVAGKMSDDYLTITGTWQNSAKKKSYPFVWKAIQQEGNAVLGVISKQYSYVWKKNKKGDELGCKSVYSLCYISSLPNAQARKKINDELLQSDEELTANNDDLKDAATEFMDDDFDSYQEDFDSAYVEANTMENEEWMNESPKLYRWERSQDCDIIFNENNLLSIQVFNNELRGGVRTNMEYTNMVFDLKTGEQLEVDDLFKPGYRNQLNELAQLQLMDKYKSGSLQQLDEKGFDLQNNFSTNDNFFIQKNGVGFTYNPNEIASNAVGVVNVIIPWSSLQQLINPGGVLSWALKK